MSHLAYWTLGCAFGAAAALAVLRVRAALSVPTAMAVGLAWGGLLVGSKLHYRLELYPTAKALLIMAEALELQRIPHELIVIPGGQHAFDVLQHDDPVVVSAAERATVFLRDRFEYATKR